MHARKIINTWAMFKLWTRIQCYLSVVRKKQPVFTTERDIRDVQGNKFALKTDVDITHAIIQEGR